MSEKKPMGIMTPEDIYEVSQIVTSQLKTLSSRGVQVMFLSNTASATIELSAFSEVENHLTTTSIVLFPFDKEKKVEFLKGCLYRLANSVGVPYDIIKEIDKTYKSKYAF